MNFQELQRRLVIHLRDRVRNGELTERGLARRTGVSQPHIHNVLKGKRFFSNETADQILLFLRLDVLDLLDRRDLTDWFRRQ
jgi:transcriptional regulator with XRE-family HTH domain